MNELDIFSAALELQSPEVRDRYLDEACGADRDLRRRIEELLGAHVQARSFIGVASARLAAATLAVPINEGPGTVIGPYKLLEQIGEGGMGVIYMAEQTQPVRRKVALKVLKPGMDTRQVIARFEAERQALAVMDHPNIAKVLEAGETASGRPYFVMELVKGISITEFCDQARLPTRERLELFLSVCRAVQHAHQKGIIHRDLKPANVLVTVQDGVPIVKVIDFGIAKATGQQLTDKTMFTGFGQMIGTPLYMSPEQAALSAVDVDTRSDVYSLGVLLYELLTGSTPFDKETLSRAGYDEMRRMIREDDPETVSARIARTNKVKSSTPGSIARRPHSTFRAPHLMELDWIVMKALEKDRNRRYETANAMAADIERYLNDEPVVACPPSAGYRLRKFVHRNKQWVTAGAALAALLVLGTAGTSIGLVWALRSEHKAKEQAAIAEAVSEFLQQDLLKQAAPDRNARDKKVTVEQLLERAAARIAGKFDQQPLVEAAIRQTIGDTYRTLSEYAAAQPHLERALEIQLGILGDEHPDTLQSMNNLALFYDNQGQTSKAEPIYQKTLEARLRLLGEEHDLTLESMNNLAVLYLDKSDLGSAKPLMESSLKISRRFKGNDHHSTLLAMNNMARLYHVQGELDKAEPLLVEALKIKRRVFGVEDSSTIASMNNLAGLYIDRGKFGEAEELLKEALATSGPVLGEEHVETLHCMNNLGFLYWRLERLDDAKPLFEKALDARRRVLGAHRDTIVSMNNLASLYEKQGLLENAIPLSKEALDTSRRALGENHPITNGCATNLASKLARFGLFRLVQGRPAEAEPLLRECLEIREARQPDDWSTFNTKSMLGGSLLGQQKYAEAEPLLLAGFEGMQQRAVTIPPPGKVRLREAIEWLVQLYESTDRPEEAARWKAQLPAGIPSPLGQQ